HYELRQLLEHLKESPKTMYFLGNDVSRYWDLIVEYLGEQAVQTTDEELNIPHASMLIECAKDVKPVENIHLFVPKYHRLPEAEMNWLLEQKK
ncbi:tRNA (adenosine(37)-N6)-threonylcarbamoyltransferase complex dimerization subunit type 1 TsaB, partial [Turicibacter sanguinis]